MKRTIRNALLVLALALMPVLAQSLPVAAACPSSSSSQGQVLSGIGETGSNCSDSGVTSTISAIVSILSLIVGVAAIIMVILGGFKYITSGGEATKVGNAKSTLIYALTGLVIAALAQLLVHFVLNQANSATLCPGHTYPASDPRCH